MRVSRTIDLPAAPEAVWRSLTDPDALAAWMGAGSAVEPRSGGRAKFTDAESGRPRSAVVTAAEPGRLLRFAWWPDDAPDDASEVELALTATAAGTRLEVVETRTPTVAASTAGEQAVAAAWTWRLAALQLALLVPALVCSR